jgi:hypothetical protein
MMRATGRFEGLKFVGLVTLCAALAIGVGAVREAPATPICPPGAVDQCSVTIPSNPCPMFTSCAESWDYNDGSSVPCPNNRNLTGDYFKPVSLVTNSWVGCRQAMSTEPHAACTSTQSPCMAVS